MLVFFLVDFCVAHAQSFRIHVIQLEQITLCQRLMYSILYTIRVLFSELSIIVITMIRLC